MNFFRPIVILSLAFLVSGCDENVVYKAHEDIKDGLWYIKDKPEFKVEIKDTLATYNLYYLIRNSLQYPYYNLYLTRKTKTPDGKVTSSLEEVFLSNQVNGKPYGKGLGDLFDHRLSLSPVRYLYLYALSVDAAKPVTVCDQCRNMRGKSGHLSKVTTRTEVNFKTRIYESLPGLGKAVVVPSGFFLGFFL